LLTVDGTDWFTSLLLLTMVFISRNDVRVRLTLALLLPLLLLPACTKDGGGDRVEVVTAVYPMTYVAQRVAGDDATVVDVAVPGAEPHDVELTPTQTGQVAQADLVLLVEGLQPAVDDAAPDDRTVDALAAAGGGADPHVWLDPLALADVADALAARLGEVDEEHSAGYAGRALQLRNDLTALHEDIAAKLKTCKHQDLVTTHDAFSRFAQRYGLRATAVSVGDADAEPSPRRIAEVVAFMRKNDVKAVYGESADSPVADTIAQETGAASGPLDTIEVRGERDYLAAMRMNLSLLALGLRC
jgi:zinc transport system substrate-binding protein